MSPAPYLLGQQRNHPCLICVVNEGHVVLTDLTSRLDVFARLLRADERDHRSQTET